jgi:endonuclease G
MAKFRRNHSKSGNFFSSTFVRVIAFLFMGAFAIYYIFKDAPSLEDYTYEIPVASEVSNRFYLPEWDTAEVIHHSFYSLAYNEEHEQADWIAYELTREQLKVPNVEREREFRRDDDIPTGSAFHRDYTRSGYTRGHLAPAGDMAFSVKAMEESFFMSNMSPQVEAFNRGIWRELEENIRDWAYADEHLYIVTGPVLRQGVITKIGDSGVGVPKYYYKVVLDIEGRNQKGIGFIIPNERSELPLENYAVTIDSVEQFTGFDFFGDLMDDALEEVIESQFKPSQWQYNKQRFLERNSRFK